MKVKPVERVAWDAIESPLGPLALVVGDQGVIAVSFVEVASDGTIAELVGTGTRVARDRKALGPLRRELEAYFIGKLTKFETPVAPIGTDFQCDVWGALATIPYGTTRTYGEVARKIGNPLASRAIGMACNRNRIAIVIPCHRVVGTSGRLVGYAGGLDKKQFLLELEKRGGHS
jgi:methylated-DNA-[protein]-cysteine S-methyltransferase